MFPIAETIVILYDESVVIDHKKNYHETNICRIFAHQSQLIGHIKSYTCNYASAATCSNDIEAGLLFMGDFSRSL